MWRSSRNIYRRLRAGYFYYFGVRMRLLLPAVSYTLPITIIVDIDRASQVLARGLPLDVPRIWAALSKRADVTLTTLYYRVYRRPFVRLGLLPYEQTSLMQLIAIKLTIFVLVADSVSLFQNRVRRLVGFLLEVPVVSLELCLKYPSVYIEWRVSGCCSPRVLFLASTTRSVSYHASWIRPASLLR